MKKDKIDYEKEIVQWLFVAPFYIGGFLYGIYLMFFSK